MVSLQGFALFICSTADFSLTFFSSPIAPGANLTYEFVPEQHGSYWIHSHYMVCFACLSSLYQTIQTNIFI